MLKKYRITGSYCIVLEINRNIVPITFNNFNLLYSLMKYEFDPPKTHTLTPIVTGSNVIGIKYKDGIIACTDMLASYGSMAMFKSYSKICSLNQYTAIVSRGDLSDYQEILKLLGKKTDEDIAFEDVTRTPRDFAKYLSRHQYYYRMKMDPWLSSSLIIGYKNSTPYLGNLLCRLR